MDQPADRVGFVTADEVQQMHQIAIECLDARSQHFRLIGTALANLNRKSIGMVRAASTDDSELGVALRQSQTAAGRSPFDGGQETDPARLIEAAEHTSEEVQNRCLSGAIGPEIDIQPGRQVIDSLLGQCPEAVDLDALKFHIRVPPWGEFKRCERENERCEPDNQTALSQDADRNRCRQACWTSEASG